MRKLLSASKYILILVVYLSACNLPASEPIPKAEPQVNIANALVVNTFRDTFDGVCSKSDCSLRDAVFAANDPTYVRNDVTKEIIYLPSGLYKLNEQTLVNDDTGIYGDLDISSTVTIQGDGAELTTIDGANNDRIFQVLRNGGNLTLYDMTLLGGTGDHKSGITGDLPNSGVIGLIEDIGCAIAAYWGDCVNAGTSGTGLPSDYKQLMWERGGGAIANRGSLHLIDVHIIGNVSQYGGGIFNVGEAELYGGRVCNNSGRYGGGIYNQGTMEIQGTIICENNEREEPESWGPAMEWLDTNFDLLDWDTWLPEFESDLLLLGGGGGIFNSTSGFIQANNIEISGNDLVNNLGKGISNKGTFFLFDSTVIGNLGNAILNSGNINISGSTIELSQISRNQGVAIINIGEAAISNTLIQNNIIPSYGGTITVWPDSILTIYQSAISDNESYFGPGAVETHGGKITMSNVSIGRNTSIQGKGTIFSEGGSTNLINVTIFDNNNVGINQELGIIWASNSIIANNSGGNCIGTIVSGGHNLSDDDSCGLDIEGDKISQEINIINVLDASSNYSYKILGASLAHDGGNLEFCPQTDQEGDPRPMGLACDIGADEIKELDGVSIVVPEDLFPTVEPSGDVVVDPEPVVEFWAEPSEITAGGCATFFWHVENVKSIIFGNREQDFDGSDKDCMCKTQTYPLTVNYLDNTQDKKFVTINVTGSCAPEAPKAEQPASLSGIVWKDANANGSQQGGEDGIPGITVFLGKGSCSSTGFKTTTSGSDGGFGFNNLSSGHYCVSVQVVETCKAYSVATTNTQYTINLNPGDNKISSFGFKKKLCD